MSGLEDVVACETSICRIAVEEDRGVLEYRGYDIHELAKNSSYEEVAFLLLFGDLPSKSEFESFKEELAMKRELPPQIIGLLTHLPPFTHPMVVLRTAISYLGSMDKHIQYKSHERSIEKSISLIAKFPTIVAYFHRIRTGQNLIHPREDLSHAENFLYMLHGEEPTETMAKSLDLDFILHAEHELNASTFAARIAASTLADMYACIVAATGTLLGPLHGGASQKVMEMLREVAVPWRAESYVREKLENGERIMGFGHRVYRKVMDPRTIELKILAKKLADEKNPKWYQISEAIEEAVYKYKGLLPNVDFYSASVYANLGIPDDLFVNIFAIGRISGWCAHVIEQYENNRLIRPRAEYVGSQQRRYVPLSDRE
ncbi:citrate synthase [Archaeoglobus sulfaticallidus PM70-1]|uniref:Citrate synthase n=1 Tax=Archaeoglobus sulfaticallidus PM70-1 TaxID=387631 RepID=N0BN60_9EURY|nr:citrate/2-methylcitrate synthase [Archaeoglobus sulfaticallidus]AGK61740.1 citrate synthase [Archaeoglobus sulfaticallidus PM70-1]